MEFQSQMISVIICPECIFTMLTVEVATNFYSREELVKDIVTN